MHLYVAGPMQGYPEHNYPAFMEAAARLREAGYQVTNPAEVELACGCPPGAHEWADYLRADIAEMLLAGVRGVALLPGWENSRGATLETHIARALGWPVERITFWLDRPDHWQEHFRRAPSSCAGVVS